MVTIRSNHRKLVPRAPYRALSLGYLNFSRPLSHINQSCWGWNAAWGGAGGARERDLFVRTCESINKPAALHPASLSLFPFACHCEPALRSATLPPLHWRLHFSPFKSLPNWHFVGRGKANPECTSLTKPRRVHMNAPLHKKNTWILLLSLPPPGVTSPWGGYKNIWTASLWSFTV